MTILRDAISFLARFFGLKPGPSVDKLPEPKPKSWQQEQWDALEREKQEKEPKR